MAILATPEYLHIPKLYKGEIAGVSFDDTGSSNYELDYVVDSDFNDGDPATITGNGFTMLGSDMGLTWSEIEDYESNWDYFDNLKTWDVIELLSSMGLSWDSIDSNQYSWDNFISSMYISNPSWDWNYLESLQPDIYLHKGFPVDVPDGRYMRFRVRSVEQNEVSEYLESSYKYIVTKVLFEGVMSTNEVLAVQLDSEFIDSYINNHFSLIYSPSIAIYTENNTSTSIKAYNGRITFDKFKDMQLDSNCEEGVISLYFTAIKTGLVQIQAEYVNKS
jgi:hypothetical protein